MTQDVKHRIEALYEEFIAAASGIQTDADVHVINEQFFSKSGKFRSNLSSTIKSLAKEERAEYGRVWNRYFDMGEKHIEDIRSNIKKKEVQAKARLHNVRMSLEIMPARIGVQHPIGIVSRDILNFFRGMGFAVRLGPDIDIDYYNFEALNFPIGHSARSMHDTFYINQNDGVLLRTHTSNVEVRTLEEMSKKGVLEDGYVSFGRCFRNEDVSSRSHMFFHQIEAFRVMKGASDLDLMGVVIGLCKHLFGGNVKVNIRASHFPFVAPGYEVDVSCIYCDMQGCTLCKQSGWLEILGCGMLHENVLKAGFGSSFSKYEGYNAYAMGLGVERIAMLKYGIYDLRLFYANTSNLWCPFSV